MITHVLTYRNRDPADRPTADSCLGSMFTWKDPNYAFYDTDLYQRIKPQVSHTVARWAAEDAG